MSASNYIVDRAPQLYGGRQDDYVKKSCEAIDYGVSEMQEALREKKDLKALFFTLLDQFGILRHAIAEEHQTYKMHHFGRKRTHTAGILDFTPLIKNYVEYNAQMITLFQKLMRGAIPMQGDPRKKQFHISEEHLGRKCAFEVEILTPKDLIARELDQIVPASLIPVFDKNKDINRALLLEPEIDEEHFPPTAEEIKKLTIYQTELKKVKDQIPDFYKHDKARFVLTNISHSFNADRDTAYLKNLFISGKMRLQIGNSMYLMAEYMTWAYQTHAMDPVERMTGRSVIIITHLDRFLIEGVLKEISQVFEKALQSPKDLKDNVALFRYLFAHTMPFARGSASIGEWFERAIYKIHGYTCKHNPQFLGDCEALTTLWSTFAKEKYTTTITLDQETNSNNNDKK